MCIKKSLLVMLLVVIPLVNAVTIQEGDVEFNTTQSHTNYTNDLNLTTLNITINKTGILFSQFNYVNGELGVNVSDNVLIDEADTAINTTAFPYLIYSDNDTKNVSSFFDKDLNATLFFDVNNCQNITNFIYNSSDDLFRETILPVNITCSDNRASSFFHNIQQAIPPNYNLISITYLPTSWRVAIIGGLISMSGLFIYVGNKQDSEFKPVKWLLFGVAGLLGLLGVFVSVLIANPNNQSVSDLIRTFYTTSVIAFGFLLAVVTIIISKRSIELLNKPQW